MKYLTLIKRNDNLQVTVIVHDKPYVKADTTNVVLTDFIKNQDDYYAATFNITEQKDQLTFVVIDEDNPLIPGENHYIDGLPVSIATKDNTIVKKTIEYWLNQISDEEVRQKAIKNMMAQNDENYWKSETTTSKAGALLKAFTFKDTEEGYNYWVDVFQSILRDQQRV